jgi:hypothetical protein
MEAAMTVAPSAGLLGRGVERGAMAAGRAGERLAERVVPQVMERGGMPAQLLGDLSQGSIRPMDVWHGTPHRFDAFDASKIGSGEGAQAFGHGLYFGEARGTGEEYRKMLSTKVDVNGKPLYDANKIVGSTGNPDLDDYLVANLGDVVAAKKNLVEDIKYVAEGNPEAAKQMQKTLEDLNNLKVDKQEAGYLYKVDLPDEEIAKMLDWDKPLSKQPKNVQDYFYSHPKVQEYVSNQNAERLRLNEQYPGRLSNPALKNIVNKEMTADSLKGSKLYELATTGYSVKDESIPVEMMRQAGIPGNRYLDQGSRVVSGGELIDVFKTPSGWKSKIKVTDRGGVGFDSPTDTFTTSMPFKTEDEARQWAQDKISGGTSNFVVFPGNENLLTIKEINDKPLKRNLLD